MQLLDTVIRFTFGDNPKLSIALRLAASRPRLASLWLDSPVLPVTILNEEHYVKAVAVAGMASNSVEEGRNYLCVYLEDLKEDYDANDMQSSVDHASRLRESLLKVIPHIRETLKNEYALGFLADGAEELAFTEGCRNLIVKHKEAQLQKNASEVSGILMKSVDKAANASAQRQLSKAEEAGYGIVIASSVGEMENKVNARAEQGWVPQGGLTIVNERDPGGGTDNPTFYQAMSKNVVELPDPTKASIYPYLIGDDEQKLIKAAAIIDQALASFGIDLPDFIRDLE